MQQFHIDGVRHITPAAAFEAMESGEAVLIDVRELAEVKQEKIPLERVLNHPMSVIMDRLPYISKGQHLILLCHSGIRSVKVANLLNRQGYPHVANLEGGMTLWKSCGLPVESNSSGGGCSCQSVQPAGAVFSPAKPVSRESASNKIDFNEIRRIKND